MRSQLDSRRLNDLSRSDRVDVICDQFEAAWRSGERPALEDHLARVDAAEQAALLGQLLPLEIEYRRKLGESPSAKEFVARFASFPSIIERALGDHSTLLLKNTPHDAQSASGGGGTSRPSREMPPTKAPTARQRVGEYEIVGPLGRGGMGVVYRAIHTKLKRPVALKLLSLERMRDPESVTRFLREMEAVGRLDSPHIVRAHDAGEIEGTYYLAMEIVDGRDLSQLVRGERTLPVNDSCECIRQAAIGLQHVHEHGLIHRDIKPSNLLLSRQGIVKIADLGLARLYGPEEASGSGMTGSDQILGTLDYMAPEQADSSHQVDIRTDIYSLGCSLYRLLAGRAPFAGPDYDSAPKKIRAHAVIAPAPLSPIRHDIPPELQNVLDRMLAKQAGDRFATPLQLVNALTPFVEGNEVERLVATLEHEFEDNVEDQLSTTSLHVYETAVRAQDESTNQQPETTPRGLRRHTILVRTRLVTALAVSMAAACLAWGGYQFIRGFLETTPSANKADARPPSAWAVFGDAIRELQWPGYAGEGFWQVDGESDRLVVTADKIRMISLGDLKPAQQAISVDLLQEPWRGQTGLFFGYRVERREGRPLATFQLIRIVPSVDDQKRPCLELRRRLVALLPESGGMIGGPEFGTRLPMPPKSESQRLEVHLNKAGINRICWAGHDVADVATAKANGAFNLADYTGPWGVFHYGGTTWFSRPKYTTDERN